MRTIAWMLVAVALWQGAAEAQTKKKTAPKKLGARVGGAKRERNTIWLQLQHLGRAAIPHPCIINNLWRVPQKSAPARQGPEPNLETLAWPVLELRVEGLKTYTEAQVIAASGLKVGQSANKAAFEAARDRLVALGAFESVGYRYAPTPDGKGYKASFQVIEIEQVYPVRFERLPAKPEEMVAFLKESEPLFSDRIPGTAPLLKHYSARLQEFLSQRGFKDRVAGKVASEGEGALFIVFQPATPPPTVAEIHFTGNEVLPSTALQNAVAGAGVGAVWDEKRFRQILDASVLPLYEARGRIRAAFPKIAAEPVPGLNGVRLRVTVAEGESYNLGDVAIEGSDLPSKDLLKAGNFKKGDLANFDGIKEGLERMRALLRKNGYLQARVAVERDIDDKEKTVSLRVRPDLGDRYTFGKLAIEGLDIHTEPVIRRLWALKPGQPFDPEYPDFFLGRVRSDGVFDNLGKTRSAVKLDEKSRTADVTLFFR